MKRWFAITVSLGLMIVAYFAVRWNPPIHLPHIWWPDDRAQRAQGDVGKMPAMQPVPKDVLEFRQQHHLVPLTELQEGKPIRELPKGIYGFSTCGVVSLRAGSGDAFPLEIHKHDDGIVYYVGYASDEHIGKYLTRQKNFHILMSPRPSEKASSLFEIPIDFISKCEERPSKGGYLFDLFVTTIPELHS